VSEPVEDRLLDGRAPRSARRPGVEARLIAAVQRLTDSGRPFSSVSVAELVAEAGIGRATFYLYFADRTAFLLRLVDHARAQIAEPLDLVWGNPALDHGALTEVIRTVVARFHRHAAIISAVLEAAAVDDLVAARLDAEMQGFIATGTTVLAFAQAAGMIRPELRPPQTAAALSWMIERVCYQAVRQAQEAELEAIAETLSAIVWHSLHPDASAPARELRATR
jgi:AcrR family transcriptional regulator